MQKRRSGSRLLRLLPHENDACAEQHREDRYELLIRQQMRKEPYEEICAVEIAIRRRIVVSDFHHRERLDIHHQDSEQRKSTQHVHWNNPFCFGNRAPELPPALRGGDRVTRADTTHLTTPSPDCPPSARVPGHPLPSSARSRRPAP